MQHIAQRFYAGKSAWTAEELGARLNAPQEALEEVLANLQRHGLIVGTAADPPGYVPGKPPETTATKSVLDGVREGSADAECRDHALAATPVVAALTESYGSAVKEALAGHMLKDLAEASDTSPQDIPESKSHSPTPTG